jgi:hypothetical protein
MTEEEWLAGADPQEMITFLGGNVPARKARLFAVACCRAAWSSLPQNPLRAAVLVGERLADGQATEGDAEAAAVGEDEFEGRWRVGAVVADVDGEEGDGGGGPVGLAVAPAEGAAPGVEGGDGEAMASAEVADGEPAVLPALDQPSPVLFLAGVVGFASGHG